jgi:hypothetical protein
VRALRSLIKRAGGATLLFNRRHFSKFNLSTCNLSLRLHTPTMLFYRYQPLQHDDSIRLLVLHPSVDGTNSDPIRCTIQHVRLSDESLEYEAVSYTWGETTRMRSIYFNRGTRKLSVRPNCYNVLWRLRRVHRDRLLWIDAICINQDNLQERASQVRIMDRIYNCASTVLAVLSEPNTNSSALFEELATADEEVRRTGRCDRDRPGGAIVTLLEELFRDPWFTRVWVLQEVYAKSFVEFICGSASFSHTSLVGLTYGYSSTLMTKRFEPVASRWIEYPPHVFSTSQFNLWNRLYKTRDCLATDPKDRVFALMSLLGPGKAETNHLINYMQSIEECYTHVATFLLPVLGLRLLAAIRHPHDKKMPSWIPDWSQNLPLQRQYFEYESLGTGGGQSGPRFYAPDNEKYAICSSVGESREGRLELFVTGCRHAQIVETSQVFQFVDIDDAEIQMKRLYCSFISLSRYVPSEGTRDDPTVLAHLGKTIKDGMTRMCAWYKQC